MWVDNEVMADHATYCKTGQHGDKEVNCIIYGKDCGLGQGKTVQSFELMEYLRERSKDNTWWNVPSWGHGIEYLPPMKTKTDATEWWGEEV